MRRLRFLALIGAVGVLGVRASADGRSYTLEILPDLVVGSVTYDHLTPVALNERGVVVGHARSSDPGHDESVLFYYRRGITRALDSGGRSAAALALNDRGVVLGEVRQVDTKRYFKTSRKGAARFLEDGLPASDLARLRPVDLGINGEVLARLDGKRGSTSYIQRGRAGRWELVTAQDPRFDYPWLFATKINGAGDILVHGTTESGRGSVFILRPDGAVEVVRPETDDVVSGSYLTDERLVVGGVSRNRRSFKAFYYDPRTGVVDIHPEGFISSLAHLKPNGQALVRASEHRRVSFFVFHPDGGFVQLWNSDDVRELGARAGCKKPEEAEIVLERWNLRHEVFAYLDCVGRGRGSVHFSPETGFTLLRDLLASLGFTGAHGTPRGFNERGQMLISLSDGDRIFPALLTPRD